MQRPDTNLPHGRHDARMHVISVCLGVVPVRLYGSILCLRRSKLREEVTV